jgi:hypothetical protein
MRRFLASSGDSSGLSMKSCKFPARDPFMEQLLAMCATRMY